MAKIEKRPTGEFSSYYGCYIIAMAALMFLGSELVVRQMHAEHKEPTRFEALRHSLETGRRIAFAV